MSLTVLIVDDEDHARLNYGTFLSNQGYTIIDVATLTEAREIIQQGSADIIVLDVRFPDGYGPSLLTETAHMPNRPPIILVTAYSEIDMAVDAMKNGAHDFLQKPINLEELGKVVARAGEIVTMRRELTHLRQTQHAQHNFILGNSPAMKTVFQQAQRAAASSVSVLITGETGTGKEVLARAIHKSGPRGDKAFIGINCASFQNSMLESELFGYEAGAFTGAEKRKPGLLEVADDGILFLDELSSMPLDIQAKLLRALEERAFRRMGGTKLIHVDVHVLAASNRNLKNMIEKQEFRDDLYYRLKVVDLHIPPLRERKQDIPELVGFFIRENNPRMGLNILDVTPRAMEMLVGHTWPGNIRELRNVIERAMLFCDDAAINVSHLPADINHAALV